MKQKSRILIIDDDPGTVSILSLILQHADYEVSSDCYGNLDFLKTGIFPDLMLLDNNLGIRNGASLCLRLKQDSSTRDIPIILESGDDDLDVLAMHSCADDYLVKPFSVELLLSKVSHLLLPKPALAG